MTRHPARPVPQGADPELAAMLGPLLDHLTEPETEPDWTNQDWRDPIRHALAPEILYELSDIEDAMAAAGHHGPLRDTIPRLIADVEAQRKNLDAARRVIAKQDRALELADQIECRVRAQRDEFERRASWVLRQAMAYCVRDLVANDD